MGFTQTLQQADIKKKITNSAAATFEEQTRVVSDVNSENIKRWLQVEFNIISPKANIRIVKSMSVRIDANTSHNKIFRAGGTDGDVNNTQSFSKIVFEKVLQTKSLGPKENVDCKNRAN